MGANWGQHKKWQERRIVGRRKSGHQEVGMGEWRAIAEHTWGTTRDRPFVERGAHWNTLLEWHYKGGCVEGNTWDLGGVDDIREGGGSGEVLSKGRDGPLKGKQDTKRSKGEMKRAIGGCNYRM